MSVEREIELIHQEGDQIVWQAYGLDEFILSVPPTVYPPRDDSSLLDRTLAELGPGHGKHLLEIGCGSGAVSIAAGLRGWKVSACDINPLAVAATRGNAASYGFEWGSEIKEGGPGDIEQWMPSQGVDVIAWNLPYIEPDSGDSLGPMEDSALIGKDEASQLLECVNYNPNLLNAGGVILLLHSSNQIGHEIGRDWRKEGWATRNVSQLVVGDERLTVVACWRPFENAMISRVESCASTNDAIFDLGMVRQGTFLSTKFQHSGRGYAGREWLSSEDGFMGSWSISEKSINNGPELIQLASNVAILDAIAATLNLGLPSHSWVHGSALEAHGVRVKWPNDIWLRTQDGFGKLCGILVEGRTQGDDVQIVLGVGINRKSVPQLIDSIGWDSLFPNTFEELLPVIHASVASVLEVHPMVRDTSIEHILNSLYSTMRCTLAEGRNLAFGLDDKGGLLTDSGIIRSTGEMRWEWI
ncbi:MAG: 50S ribosomal protein L11 methyltransferase [Candidatus Thalassarchaeaceae archaeon]|nr:50S ribosomal protein L11 methyltransferase [Candidatus Thalassarchaeaceae archaeon]